ncbi:MAG TPA: hypothetical protein VF607_07490, partial [Verrucomicrobiae bacterium]
MSPRRLGILLLSLTALVIVAWRQHRHPIATSGAAAMTGDQMVAASPGNNSSWDGVTPPSTWKTAVLAAFQVTDPRQRAIQFGRAYAEWFALDPEAALAWLALIPQTAEYTQGLLIALPAIGTHDPHRALELAGSMAVTREQQAVYNQLFAQFWRQDPALALGWLETLTPGAARELALHTVADQWDRQDPAAARQWAATLSDPAERQQVETDLLIRQARQEPAEAMAQAAKILDAASYQQVLSAGMQAWLARDPAAATKAIGELPAGEMQNTLTGQAARVL